ncbi:uncharacterized protein LOC129778822 isoform X2 [Toxorhynchites rutilus septentrionalis]|uniref:uncharacterized protein LOC129778822 isoform X2 n=1 Tax=Toxorhynchites rutilus septentrionalis TaxID=329112 RepID=UPI00247A00FF|nr:uncharacterized protein LOC129778822 isoform X2 [Toxorhynchites rutilus septentrionalis]
MRICKVPLMICVLASRYHRSCSSTYLSRWSSHPRLSVDTQHPCFKHASHGFRSSASDLKVTMDPAAFGLTEDDVELVVKRYLQEKRDKYNAKFRVLSYHVKRLSEEPIGYLGDHYFLNVVLREKMVHYSEEEEEYAEEEYLSFFMKVLPEQVPKLADYVREMGCFRKEIQLYTHLIPRLQDVSIGTKPFAPRAYLTKDDKMLIFENLKAEGYRMVEHNKSLLDLAHLEVALKTVAKLHAASLVLEERTKQPITKLYSGHLNENVYINDEGYVRKTNLDNAIRALCELIKRIDKYKHSDQLDFILEKFPEVIRKIYDFAKPSTVYRNVFNHGDLWNNNLMFKYEESDKSRANSDAGFAEAGADGQSHHHQQKQHQCGLPHPVSCMLLDFQLARYAPPALDVLTVIMLCSDSGFRREYLDALLNNYYADLVQHAACHNVNLAQVLPRNDFNASCKHYHLAGLIESCLFSHFTLIPGDLVAPLMQSSESFDAYIHDEGAKIALCLAAFEQNETYRTRLTDMLQEIIEKYIL